MFRLFYYVRHLLSAESSAVTGEFLQYLASRTRPEDQFLIQLKAAAQEAGIPPIWIAPEQANFMQILLKLCNARRVVEIGTLAGYSAIVLARALPQDGLVQTIELNEVHARFAEQWIERSDVSNRIAVLRGDASTILNTMAAQSADAAFIDADKENYIPYLEQCMRIVRPGGLIMADNAFAFGQLFSDHAADPEVEALRRFNECIAHMNNLHSIIVPLGDGCWVGVKL